MRWQLKPAFKLLATTMNKMTEPLSPATQAVLDASNLLPGKDSYLILAAALRAAADQVVPEFWHEDEDIYGWTMQDIRKQLLAIAAELEGCND
jgi:hypothetical protein